MTGYVRQSSADIVPTAVVRAAPINNELNALRDAFEQTAGHKHDGTAAEGHYVPLIGDADAKNKVAVDTVNNRVGVFVEVSGTSTEQVRVQDGAIVPVTDNDIDLGTSLLEFKDLYIDGTANIDSLIADTADINAGTIDNTVVGATTPAAATVTNLTVNTAAVIASADINAGTIDGAVIGGASAQAITGTTITATTGFVGGLTGAVTGNTTGTHTGAVVGNVTGDLTGNVTASSGSSSFNDVVINGNLNMNAGTTATIINLTAPTNAGDAATKGYVDTADALKVAKAGDTMSGNLAMGGNKVTGLATPTATGDAATKGYVDTSISNLLDSAPGALDTLNELAAALGDDPNFATTVTNEIATKVSKAGDTMSGNLAMGGNKVTGLGAPTLSADAATKSYVDTADALKLNLSGGTMSGTIAMGSNSITGLAAPTAGTDAATKSYVDTADALKLSLTGGTMSGAIAMGSNKITGLGTPTADTDATTKVYVDGILGSATAAAASAAAAATSASNAATSETNAGNSASSASASAAAAAASYDSFDDRYLGAKASAPTLDNDGNALLTGALYWNTTSNELFLWTGSVWSQATLTSAGFVTLTGNETLTNKTINGSNNTITNISLTTGVTGTLPVGNGGTGASALTLNNVLLGNGTSALQVVAPGTTGNVLTSNGTTWASSALPAGGLTYIFTTTPVTATDKQGVLADTSGGAFTVTLPATPSTGAQVVVADAGSSWGTNNLTVARNGSTINGTAENLICDISGASIQFVYDGTTWEVYAQIGGNAGAVVTLTDTQTLTNKTIAFGSNTLTDVAGTTATQTLTNKTLTTPVITQNVQVISGNTTAVASRTYVLTASLTLTLPASPTAGDWVAVQNSSGTTTAVIARNGSNIMSLAENMTIDNATASLTLMYADATRGWVISL